MPLRPVRPTASVPPGQAGPLSRLAEPVSVQVKKGKGGPSPQARRRARRARVTRKWVAIALFLAPALALYCLLVVAPIFQAFHYSGYKWNGLSSPTDFVGLDNFKRAFQDDVFRGALKHNAIFILLSLAVQLPFALGIAWILNQRLKGRALLRILFFAPFVLSEVVAAVVVADAPAAGADRPRAELGRTGLGHPRLAGGPEHRLAARAPDAAGCGASAGAARST